MQKLQPKRFFASLGLLLDCCPVGLLPGAQGEMGHKDRRTILLGTIDRAFAPFGLDQQGTNESCEVETLLTSSLEPVVEP